MLASHRGDLGGGVSGLVWEIDIQVEVSISSGIAAGLEGAVRILSCDIAEAIAGFVPSTLGIVTAASGLADTASSGLFGLDHSLLGGTLLEGLDAPVGDEGLLHCNEALAALLLAVVFDGTLVGNVLGLLLWSLHVAVLCSVTNFRNDSRDVRVDLLLDISDNLDDEVLADLKRKLSRSDAGSDESVSVINAIAVLGEASVREHLCASAELAGSDVGGFVFHGCVLVWIY